MSVAPVAIDPATGFASSSYDLAIGNVTFADLEHPQSLPIPLSQQIAVHQQAGGTRTVQAFGVQPGAISFSGTFYFGNALSRAASLRAMATAGQPVTLQYGAWSWLGIISKCDLDIHHQYEVAYSLTFEVIQDNTGQATIATTTSVDTQNQSLFTQATARTSALNNLDSSTSSWTTTMAQVEAALVAVSPLASASNASLTAAISAVTAAIGVVLPYVQGMRSSTTQAGMQSLFLAQGVLSALRLIATNLQSGNPTRTATVAGGDLVELATTLYSDPTLWTVIAQANGLWSMTTLVASGSQLIIPPKPASAAA